MRFSVATPAPFAVCEKRRLGSLVVMVTVVSLGAGELAEIVCRSSRWRPTVIGLAIRPVAVTVAVTTLMAPLGVLKVAGVPAVRLVAPTVSELKLTVAALLAA